MSDLIDRQMAIDSIQYAGKIGKLTCIDILKRLPSAQSERKTGRWIHCDDGSPSWRCSVCGKHAYGCYAEVFCGEYHYCPNCGARMSGVEHE